MNKDNLIPAAHKLTVEEQSNGGKASVEARRKKRDLRRALETILEKDWLDKEGNIISGTDAIATKLFEQAMKGNVKAFIAIRETIGQNPVQKIEMAQVDPEIVNEVEELVYSDES